MAEPGSNVRWQEGLTGVVRLSFPARVDGGVIGRLHDELVRFLGTQTLRGALIDGAAVASYSMDVREPGVALLRFLRERGVDRAVAVSSAASVRMIGAAIAFAAGLPVVFVGTEAEALAFCRREQ